MCGTIKTTHIEKKGKKDGEKERGTGILIFGTFLEEKNTTPYIFGHLIVSIF